MFIEIKGAQLNKDLEESKSERQKVKKTLKDTQDDIFLLRSKIRSAKNELQKYKVVLFVEKRVWEINVWKKRKLGGNWNAVETMENGRRRNERNSKLSAEKLKRIDKSMKKKGKL